MFTIEQILEHERHLYKPEERLSREYLEDLFSEFYDGKKSIGKSDMSDEDRKKIIEASQSLFNKITV